MQRPPSPCPIPAFEAIAEIARRAGADTRFAVFLDYDGTLAPIAELPELARLPQATADVLERLSAHAEVTIVSGRLVDEVADLVRLPALTYVGSHGFEAMRAGAPRETLAGNDLVVATIEDAARALAADLAPIPGALVEAKRFALAVHVRLVAAEFLPVVEAAVLRAAADHPGLLVTTGRQVYELRPDLPWHKGAALREFRARAGVAPEHTIMVGDDATDEDAFRVVRGVGFGVVVGPRARGATAAEYALADTEDVRAWLATLADILEAAEAPVGGRP